jgi:homoserine acetyltransferase
VYRRIDSDLGHDAFLVERDKLGRVVEDFLAAPPTP